MNTPPLVAPAEDARAAAGIRRTKARVGLAGFCVAGLGAYAHGDVLFSAGVRALAGGVTGYLVPHGDRAALAGRMLELAADRALVERLGHAARSFAEGLSWDSAARATLTQIEQLIAERMGGH